MINKGTNVDPEKIFYIQKRNGFCYLLADAEENENYASDGYDGYRVVEYNDVILSPSLFESFDRAYWSARERSRKSIGYAREGEDAGENKIPIQDYLYGYVESVCPEILFTSNSAFPAEFENLSDGYYLLVFEGRLWERAV